MQLRKGEAAIGSTQTGILSAKSVCFRLFKISEERRGEADENDNAYQQSMMT